MGFLKKGNKDNNKVDQSFVNPEIESSSVDYEVADDSGSSNNSCIVEEMSDDEVLKARNNEVMDFLGNFSESGQEEVVFSERSNIDVDIDVVLAGGDKEHHFGSYLAILVFIIGAVLVFGVAYVISNYNLVSYPVYGADYIISNKYSLAPKNPIVYSSDIKTDDIVLYKTDGKSRFVDQYNRAIVKEINNRVVKAYDESKKKNINIPYEQLRYVINKEMDSTDLIYSEDKEDSSSSDEIENDSSSDEIENSEGEGSDIPVIEPQQNAE